MNKELFVSSTPHETKVGLVEDDLLAEIYLERENEYTLAGSIYKGRVTRVLPGMQSAFVDIGLERDAFLYVSDFMELEEHDEDVTDVVPANRGVQDMRGPAPATEQSPAAAAAGELEAGLEGGAAAHDGDGEGNFESQPSGLAAVSSEPSGGSDSTDRERGGWRGRRRRRGGRRDGRGDGRDRNLEPRSPRPMPESVAPAVARPQEPARAPQFGPPAGYQPIILPGESISKYRGLAQPVEAQEHRYQETSAPRTAETPVEMAAPISKSFPEDEPIFAETASVAVPPHEEVEEKQPAREEQVESASTSVDWNREFHRRDTVSDSAAAAAARAAEADVVEEEVEEEEEDDRLDDRLVAIPEHSDRVPAPPVQEVPAFAAAGTLEEETIDEEEAETLRYEESSDEGYEEFEEETRAAGQPSVEIGQHELAQVRETVDEIHMSSLADAGIASAPAAESEDDSEELELEEAQAEAEAMLAAEARRRERRCPS